MATLANLIARGEGERRPTVILPRAEHETAAAAACGERRLEFTAESEARGGIEQNQGRGICTVGSVYVHHILHTIERFYYK